MPELAEVETPKNAGFVNRGVNYETRRKRLEEEEEELRPVRTGAVVFIPEEEEEEAEDEICVSAHIKRSR